MKYQGGTILCLDSATVTGVCSGVPGGTPTLETVNFGGREHDDEFDIWARAQLWIIRRIAKDLPTLITLESLVPQYDKTIQAGLFACFGGVARNKGIPILIAPIQSWRAFVLGNGRLNKKSAKDRAMQVCAWLEWPAPDHNAAEAACQWIWACSRVAPRSTLPRIPLFLNEPGSPGKKREMRAA